MTDILYEIYLPFPPTVNSYYSHTKFGVYLSKKGRLYSGKVLDAVRVQNCADRIDIEIRVEVDLYPPDKRIRDLDNYMKALLDSLTKADVWVDDSQIDQLSIQRGERIKLGAVLVRIYRAESILEAP